MANTIRTMMTINFDSTLEGLSRPQGWHQVLHTSRALPNQIDWVGVHPSENHRKQFSCCFPQASFWLVCKDRQFKPVEATWSNVHRRTWPHSQGHRKGRSLGKSWDAKSGVSSCRLKCEVKLTVSKFAPTILALQTTVNVQLSLGNFPHSRCKVGHSYPVALANFPSS